MKVRLNSVTGIDDAIVSMFVSKHTLTSELEDQIRNTVESVTSRDGKYCPSVLISEEVENYNKWVTQLCSWGKRHITMLRFIDFSVTVYGLHRGGQDDWDAHAKRFDNRIIRNSSRAGGIKRFDNLQNLSDYYKDKVLTTDAAVELLNLDLPDTIKYNDSVYIRTFNAYIREDCKDNQDVKRGLYNLGFPSDFIFKINLTEYAHVYKERNSKGTANPEVKECAESLADQIENFQPKFTRDLLLEILN